jgi:hypothetical protein
MYMRFGRTLDRGRHLIIRERLRVFFSGMNELRIAFLGGYGVDRGGHAVKELAGQPIRSALFALLVLE